MMFHDPFLSCNKIFSLRGEVKSSHFNTLSNTLSTSIKGRKRWVDVSTPPPHITQLIGTSGETTFLIARFQHVNIRSRKNFLENATTFDLAGLFQKTTQTAIIYNQFLHYVIRRIDLENTIFLRLPILRILYHRAIQSPS